MTKSKKQIYSEAIKQIAIQLNFEFCGISASGFLEDEAVKLENWLKNGFNGKMEYMQNHFDKRLDTRLLVPNSKSVISLLYNYATPLKQEDVLAPKISKYAFGVDYHYVIKEKLREFESRIKDLVGDIEMRSFVDSAPVMERSWAKKAGLGWIGKHTLLINKKKGSYFFLAEIILDVELEYDAAVADFCGTCTKCIDACPTEAITPYNVDGSKCISYLTIELKDNLPNEFKGKMENWMFGCDICQEVCPWNRFSEQHNEVQFNPLKELLEMKKEDWQELEKETFSKLFSKSAVKRTKFEGLKRNIQFLDNENTKV